MPRAGRPGSFKAAREDFPAVPGPSDDQLLRMMREVEDREDLADATLDDENPEPAGEPCPHCGEPAEHLGECRVCHEPGCLPPDLWTPGQQDPCLTLCVRCAREIHAGCAAEDEAGNPRCPTCAF